MAFTVALTGGIGSGKSTVSDMFAELGADVVDTDEIARALTTKDQPAIRRIEQSFGPEMVESDGSLNRNRMRELAFSDPGARQTLQDILHPLIRVEVQRRIAETTHPYVMLVVPLLVESRGYDTADRVLVVDCPEEKQIERVVRRSGLSPDQIRQIMATQASREDRLAVAHDVIRNEGGISELRSHVRDLHQQYLTLAA